MTRILVMEDDALVRDWVAGVLTEKGFAVDLAKAGNEGLARLDQARADLLIVDLVMPQVSGFEVLSTLEKKGRRIPTIVTSGIVIPGVHDYLKTHPQVRILSKPFTAEELLEAAEELLEPPQQQK